MRHKEISDLPKIKCQVPESRLPILQCASQRAPLWKDSSGLPTGSTPCPLQTLLSCPRECRVSVLYPAGW